MDRRAFLRLAAAGASLGAASGIARLAEAEQPADPLARPDLLAALGPAAVRDVGAKYRAATPAERDAAGLRSALGGVGTSAESVARRVREDFAAGRTVVVGGWVLSVTEARQCALFSLAGH